MSLELNGDGARERMELAPSRSGRAVLSFDTVGLVLWPGIFGMLPAAIWFGSLSWPLSFLTPPSPGDGALSTTLVVLFMALAMFVVLVGPGLAAGLVQRARQPRGAHIEWDDEGIVEWDGAWQRTTIPWSRLKVAWQAASLRSGLTSALQLRDRETGALVHVWAIAPWGVPPVRRRIYTSTSEIRALVEAIESRDPHFAQARETALKERGSDASVGSPDWSLAADRWEPRWLVRVGRLGYVGAVVAPVLAIAPSPSGIGPVTIAAGVLSFASAGLLVLRAQPVYRERRVITLALATLPADQPESAALCMKRKAVSVEMFLRFTFAALVVYSTTAAALFSAAHP